MRKLSKIQSCQNCNLCYNQQPLLDDIKKAEVFWVGLSAVKVEDIKNEKPLSPNTNTGKLISAVEESNKETSFYKTNLVKCLPLKDDKIRYPKEHEMKSCVNNLELEIKKSKPKVVFLLGKMVSDFIFGKENQEKPKLDDNFNYKATKINNVYYVPVHHPSYVLVYKRKHLKKYTEKLSYFIENPLFANA